MRVRVTVPFEPGLTLSYEGSPSSLVAELLLLDRNTGSVVQSTPKDSIGEGSIGLSFPFRLDGEGTTIITLANPSTTEEVMYCVFLLYNGKTYTWVEDKTLTPGEVRHIDVRRLRDEQIPGELEELLPPDLTAGQVNTVVHNEQDTYHKMIGQSVQVHPGGETSAFLSCPMCPPSPSHVTLSPLSFTGNIGSSQQIWPYIHWSNGTYKVNNNPYAIDWDPANSSIATVSEAWYNFRVQFGPQPGSTTIDAEMPNECYWEFDEYTGQCECLYELPVYTLAAAQVQSQCHTSQFSNYHRHKAGRRVSILPIQLGFKYWELN